MTVFKVYDYDKYVPHRKQATWFFYKVDTKDLRKAVRILWKVFGDAVRYDVL